MVIIESDEDGNYIGYKFVDGLRDYSGFWDQYRDRFSEGYPN